MADATTGNATLRQSVPLVIVRGTSSAAYYAFLPFMALWLVRVHGMPIAGAGIAVGAFILATRGGAVFVVELVRRSGPKTTAVCGTALATVLLVVAWLLNSNSVQAWTVLALCTGLAFSVATLSLRTLVAATVTSSDSRLWGFSVLNLAVNAGSGIGPVIGGAVASLAIERLPLVAALLAGVAAVAAFWLPKPAPHFFTGDTHPTAGRPETGPGRRFGFVPFLLVTSLTWVAYAQMFNVMPLYASTHIDPALIGSLFAVNAVLIVLLQLPVTAALQRRSARLGADHIGPVRMANLVLAASLLLLLPVPTSLWWLIFGGIILFTLAELMWSPVYDALVLEVFGRKRQVAGYAWAGVVWGGAEAGGTYIGISLVGGGEQSGMGHWAFVMGACAAVAAAGGLGRVRARLRSTSDEPAIS